MNAGRRHAADRRFRRIQPPITGVERGELVVAEIAFDLLDSSKPARPRRGQHLRHRRLPALLMAHAEHEPVFGAGLDSGLGFFFGQCKRLLAENVLSCGDRAFDLPGVKRMWRGKDDGLHARVLQRFNVAAVVRKTVGFGKLLAGRIGLRRANDLDVVRGLLQHGAHLLAPPAEADHRDFDGSGFFHFKISTCAGLDLDPGRPRICLHARSLLPDAAVLLRAYWRESIGRYAC